MLYFVLVVKNGAYEITQCNGRESADSLRSLIPGSIAISRGGLTVNEAKNDLSCSLSASGHSVVFNAGVFIG